MGNKKERLMRPWVEKFMNAVGHVMIVWMGLGVFTILCEKFPAMKAIFIATGEGVQSAFWWC